MFFPQLKKKPTARVMAETDLEENDRLILKYEDLAHYNAKMAEYLREKKVRLQEHIGQAQGA